MRPRIAQPPNRPSIAVDLNQLRHVSISASAGSGKTYRLTNRYLQLVAAGAEPETILASTFTRAAAGEIRDRILKRLVEAIDSEDKRKELGKELGDTNVTREALLALLVRLARRLDRVSGGVRTLDSFFAAVVHAFAIELEIPPGAEVVDEHDDAQMRSEAIRLMLDERQPQDLVNLLRSLTGSSQRSVTQVIDRTVANLYAAFCECDEHAWDWPPTPQWQRLAEDDISEAIEQLRQVEPAKAWAKAHAASIQSAWARDWNAFLAKGVPAKVLANDLTFSKKAIDPQAVAAYQPLVNHARRVLIDRERERNRAAFDMLRLFHRHYQQVKRRRGAITFDDLVNAMAKAETLGAMDAIGFRLDAKLHHLLLDEFQDTSISQWNALAPIAHEIISNAPPERTFFCVGDVKQSIYGWRGAAPEVLEALPNLLVGPDGESAIEMQTLSKSYRSSPIVIDAVNRVFGSLRENPALHNVPEAVEAWLEGFQEHSTHKRNLPGYVQLQVTNATSRADATRKRFAAAADLAADLHQKNPHLSIALLTRSNAAVAALLYELGPSRRHIAGGVSGRGGGPLTDAPAVNAVLDLLQMADHPDDTVAAFNVANSPLGEAVDFTRFDDVATRRRLARTVRAQVMNDGYAKTISHWVNAITPHADAHEVRRLRQLIEQAMMHDERRTLRTGDFIALIEETAVARTQPAAIQVMTVHQSKGMEFDVVILPELEGRLIGNSPAVVFERAGDSGTGKISMICRYLSSEKLALLADDHGDSPFHRMHERYRHRTIRESLCVLYVAMTRARHALHMIIDPPLNATIPQSAAGLLRCALPTVDLKPDSIAYEHGDPHWWKAIKPEQSSDEHAKLLHRSDVAVSALRLPKPHTGVRFGVSARSASDLAGRTTPLRQMLSITGNEARDRGTALHALFEHIEWIEDFAATDAALGELVRRKLPRRDATWAQARVSEFRAALVQPQIAKALSRADVDLNRVQLYRERRFVRMIHGEHGGLQSGAIDRLIVHRDQSQSPTAACIYDFKTDAIAAGDTAALAAHYRAQLEAYRCTVAELFNIAPAQVAMRLLFIQPAIVVDV